MSEPVPSAPGVVPVRMTVEYSDGTSRSFRLLPEPAWSPPKAPAAAVDGAAEQRARMVVTLLLARRPFGQGVSEEQILEALEHDGFSPVEARRALDALAHAGSVFRSTTGWQAVPLGRPPRVSPQRVG